MGSVGLFGGTFDPVHYGHIHLCLELQKACDLSQVWVAPTFVSPLRTEAPPIAFHHRMTMARLAFGSLPGFFVVDWDQKFPCYTIHLVKHALTLTDQLYLLLGEDCVESLSRWEQIDELIQIVPLRIGSRTHRVVSLEEPLKTVVAESLVPISPLDISASQIREKLKSKSYVRDLIPEVVLDYIQTHTLYS
jgi:nicotinate-nucleotide adenylyltransferase